MRRCQALRKINKQEQLQKIAELIRYNAKVMNYIQAQGRLQVIMSDIYKIIGESVSEGLDIFEQK